MAHHDHHLNQFGAIQKLEVVEKQGTLDDEFDIRISKLFLAPQPRQYCKEDGTLVREAEERKATFNELFYDLIYVCCIALLSHDLSNNPDWKHFGKFILIFYAIWSTWSETTKYTNRFDAFDLGTKFYIFVQMLGLVGMGVCTRDVILAHDMNANGLFGCSFALTRVANVVMHSIVAVTSETARFTAGCQAVIGLITAVLWIIGGFITYKGNVGLWVLGAIVEIVLNILIAIAFHVLSWDWKEIPYNIEHLAERFGLFSIIIMGDIMFAILPEHIRYVTSNFLVIICGLVIVFDIEWLYFDVEGGRQECHALIRTWYTSVAWFWIHLPLCMAIACVGAGLRVIVHELIASSFDTTEGAKNGTTTEPTTTGEVPTPMVAKWLLCGGVGFCLIFLGLIGVLHDSKHKVRLRWEIRVMVRVFMGALTIILPAITHHIEVQYLVLIVAIFTSLVTCVEVYGILVPSQYHWFSDNRPHVFHDRGKNMMQLLSVTGSTMMRTKKPNPGVELHAL